MSDKNVTEVSKYSISEQFHLKLLFFWSQKSVSGIRQRCGKGSAGQVWQSAAGGHKPTADEGKKGCFRDDSQN
jgi:hypothetical protein